MIFLIALETYLAGCLICYFVDNNKPFDKSLVAFLSTLIVSLGAFIVL
jgi:hypothetical protein